MKKIITIFIFFWISNVIFAENNLKEYSDSINPLLEEVKVIYEDEIERYRVLIYRGGYEHVTAFFQIQKFTITDELKSISYKLESSRTIDEINNIYNFGLSSLKKNENGFLITLDATHSYLYKETDIIIQLYHNLEYKIISGLVEL